MASRPSAFGIPAELNTSKDTYDPKLEDEAVQWIEARTGKQSIGAGVDNLHAWLKDGIILCELINSFKTTGVTCDPSTGPNLSAFKEMENIGKFLGATFQVGVPKTDMFQTIDLYEKANMAKLVNGIHALSRALVRSEPGPMIGRM